MQSIAKEMSRCLNAWPSNRDFSVEQVLAEHPEFADSSLAMEQLVLEEYARRLEIGERLSPSAFCERFSSVSPSLTRHLRNLAELNRRHDLLGDRPGELWQFPQPGDEVNGYTLVEEIGRGAFSRVFLAKDGHVADRQVVVKTTFHGCAEIELLGPLSHPHLPRIFYCKRDERTGVTTICMDWIGRRTVNDLVTELHYPDEEADRLAPGRIVAAAVDVTRQVADGLAYAHEQNVLHLDVKPSNILLRDDGTAVLIDFNLAVDASESREVGFRGTLAYAAPEVIAAAVKDAETSSLESVTEAADVYSLGTVLYELLTGDVPFPDVPAGPVEESALETLTMKQRPVAAPSEINPAVDRKLERIVCKALAPRPEDRYPTAEQFYDAVREYSLPTRERSTQRSVVLALCVVVILFTVFFSGSHGTAPSSGPGASSPTAWIEESAGTEQSAARVVDERASEALPPPVDTEQELLAGWQRLLDADPDAGLKIFRRASQFSEDPRLTTSAAYGRIMQGQFEEASAVLKETIKRDIYRDDAGVACAFAYCCLSTGKGIDQARVALLGALIGQPEHEIALFLRALVEVEISETTQSSPSPEFVDKLIALDTPTSKSFAEAVDAYRESRNRRQIDEQLVTALNQSDWSSLASESRLIFSLSPDFLQSLAPRLAVVDSGQ